MHNFSLQLWWFILGQVWFWFRFTFRFTGFVGIGWFILVIIWCLDFVGGFWVWGGPCTGLVLDFWFWFQVCLVSLVFGVGFLRWLFWVRVC